MEQKGKNKYPDITDKIYDLSETSDEDTIFLDLQQDEPQLPNTISKDNNVESSMRTNSVLFDFAREIFSVESIKDLYEVLIFSLIGQLGCSTVSIIQPSTTTEGRWFLAEHHGSRLRNRNITFHDSKNIISSIIKSEDPIELTKYENSSEDIDEYQKFFSLGARLAVSVNKDEKTVFILLLGQKLELQEYGDRDFELIRSVIDITALVFSRIGEVDGLRQELTNLKILEERLDRFDQYEFDVHSKSAKYIDQIIQTEMESLEIVSYAYFLFNNITNRYDVQFCDKNDSLDLLKNNFSINSNNALVSYCQSLTDYTEVENPVSSGILLKVFPKDFLIRVNVFGIYASTVKRQLSGILFILRTKSDSYTDNISQLKRFSRFVFNQMYIKNNLTYANHHVDTLQPLFSRLEKEYQGCRLLGIPLVIAIMRIAGYEKILQRLKLEKIQELQEVFDSIFGKNKGETDFSFRLSFKEFCFVFPGKEKKQVTKAVSSMKYGIENLSDDFTVSFKIYMYPEETRSFAEILCEIV